MLLKHMKINIYFNLCLSIFTQKIKHAHLVMKEEKKLHRSLFQSVPVFSWICIPFSNAVLLQRHLAPAFKTTIRAFQLLFFKPPFSYHRKITKNYQQIPARGRSEQTESVRRMQKLKFVFQKAQWPLFRRMTGVKRIRRRAQQCSVLQA